VNEDGEGDGWRGCWVERVEGGGWRVENGGWRVEGADDAANVMDKI
jgi:hypothetical protein